MLQTNRQTDNKGHLKLSSRQSASQLHIVKRIRGAVGCT